MLTKAFRLFVSSTFADFAQERELLQSNVFPALDAHCASKGYQFYSLDLRWGVSEEAQLDQRTAEICLGEVEAAKDYPPPNFLMLVGNRYGWVPLPYAIARDEFEALTQWLKSHGEQEAVRDLDKVYQRDDNYLVSGGLSTTSRRDQLVSAYTLRSRADEAPELKPAQVWARLEAVLRRVLQKAADALLKEEKINAAAHAKYFLSLTEQEINRGLRSDKHGSSTTTFSSQPSPAVCQAIAFFRESVSHPPSNSCFVKEEDPVDKRLNALKERIKRALPDGDLLTATATWQAGGRFDVAYGKAFADQVLNRLKAAVDQQIAAIEGMEADFAFPRGRAEHVAFRQEKLKVFVGQESNLKTIRSYIAGSADHPLVLHGRSGLGKSALMAKAIAEADTPGGPPVIYRFIGASAASSNLRSLFASLVEELVLAHSIFIAEYHPGETDNELAQQIRELLSSLTQPVIIFLDALDQLRNPGLAWFPDKLPREVRLVVSVLNDPAYKTDSGSYEGLRQRLPNDAFLEIDPLKGQDGREILLKLESDAHRRLRDDQRDYILRQFETANASPLWLRTAFEIAKSWKSTDKPGEAGHVLVPNTAALIAKFIDDLTAVHHHARQLVTRTLGYLTAAKDGLSAKELTEVLSDDGGVLKAISSEHAYAKSLPPSVWVRLNRQLSPFLVEKRVDDQPLLQFFHRQVAQVAHEQHYDGSAKNQLHAALATYFDSPGVRREGQAVYNKRNLSELPYQLFHAQRRARLDEILMAPDWMQQKLAASGPRTLVNDYQYAHTRVQKLTGQALQLAGGVLARDESQLIPQVLARLRSNLADEPAEAGALEGLLHTCQARLIPPALVPRWASFTAPSGPEVLRFQGYGSGVGALAFSPDGSHVVSGSWDGTLSLWEVETGESRTHEGHREAVRTVAFSPDGSHVVSGSWDGTLRLWDVARWRASTSFATAGTSRELRSEGCTVEAVAFSPDGTHFVAGSDDGALTVWDVATRASRELKGFGGRVTAVAFSPDGRHAICGCEDGTLRLSEMTSGVSRELEGHCEAVRTVAFSPDGLQVVAGSDDGALTVWDVATGASLGLEGHRGEVNAVAFSPDGRHIVSGSHDQTLRLWEVSSGASRVLSDRGHAACAVAFSPDGRHIVSGSEEGPRIGRATLRLWDVAGGTLCEFEGHRGEVNAVAFSPDGCHIVSGSDDHTLRLWEVSTGASRALEVHDSRVTEVAFSPDGRHVVSGSEDGTLQLWDTASGDSSELEGHATVVRAVAFSPDGRHIASGSNDHMLRLARWQAATRAS